MTGAATANIAAAAAAVVVDIVVTVLLRLLLLPLIYCHFYGYFFPELLLPKKDTKHC